MEKTLQWRSYQSGYNLIELGQSGYNLIELGLVLLVIAFAGLFGYSKFIEHNENVVSAEEADNITQYVSKTKSAYAMDSDFSLVNTTGLRTTGVFPASMVQGSNVLNKYQGVVTAVPNAITHPGDSVLFTSTNYTEAGCRAVVPRMASIARTVSVNGTVVKPLDLPLVRDALGAACTVAVNTITFAVSK
jgi:hypothetical protein